MKKLALISLFLCMTSSAFAETITRIEQRSQLVSQKIIRVGECNVSTSSGNLYVSYINYTTLDTSKNYLVRVTYESGWQDQYTLISESIIPGTLTTDQKEAVQRQQADSHEDYEFTLKSCKLRRSAYVQDVSNFKN